MPGLLDPLSDEGRQLGGLVAHAHAIAGTCPVWRFVAQQAFGKHGIDAEAALRSLPEWRGPDVTSYQPSSAEPGVMCERTSLSAGLAQFRIGRERGQRLPAISPGWVCGRRGNGGDHPL
jgi:hypothetical protein